MNTDARPCDRAAIDAFLMRPDARHDDVELIDHLDRCPACRAYVESSAGSEADWALAAKFLQPSAFDHATDPDYSAASGEGRPAERSAVIQSVLAALAPAEDPRHLGRLDGYAISGVIGAGGMGVVLKAIDPSLDRVVAIKCLAPHLAHTATARRRFAREAKAAAAVLHPNVIPIHSVSGDGPLPYLVMAYIPGGSLQKRIDADGAMRVDQILSIGVQIAAGLAVAHEQGLVHRDVKPENILLDEGIERVTLTDFGLARAVDDTSVTQPGVIAGTPRSMSPEQARGESIDQRSDLFSLGSVLYTMCTGRPPFRAETTPGVLHAICTETPTPIRACNAEIPPWLCDTIECLMAKSRDDRFTSASELRTHLEACLLHLRQPSTTALPRMTDVTSRRAWRWGRVVRHARTRLGATVMSIVTLVTAAAISIAVTRGDSASPESAAAGSSPPAVQERTAEPAGADWSLGHGYARRGDQILFDGRLIEQEGRDTLAEFERTMGRSLVLAHDVDAESFAALSEEYAKDKDTVYFKWTSPGLFWVVEIPGADPATFDVMDFNLAKDANHVWRTDVPIRGADPATARVVNPGFVWKDATTVYYQFTPLRGVDPATFRHLDQAFYRDVTQVYWSSTPLAGADANTFRTFGNDTPYAVDARSVWFGAQRLPQVDAASFRFLHNHVFADAKRVYVSGKALPVLDADPSSFQKVAELTTADCVLFRDDQRSFVFDPLYTEIYTLTAVADGIRISKPVWFERPRGTIRQAALVTATWRDGVLSPPTIDMLPETKADHVPQWEVGKMQRMGDVIREVVERASRVGAADLAPGASGVIRRTVSAGRVAPATTHSRGRRG